MAYKLDFWIYPKQRPDVADIQYPAGYESHIRFPRFQMQGRSKATLGQMNQNSAVQARPLPQAEQVDRDASDNDIAEAVHKSAR
ncbi:MAG: hypothetical protein P4L70_11420 [Parasulfuritortus sp.]|nr:hypothetical protein [Parasulfuritortus sp.]